jgi:galactokinase
MNRFEQIFGAPPAVTASAPGRVNLLGEHTDYNDGYVLPTAIAQRTSVALRPNGGERFVLHAENLASHGEVHSAAPPPDQFARYVFGCIAAGGGTWRAGALPGHRGRLPGADGDRPVVERRARGGRAARIAHAARPKFDDVRLAQLAQRAEIDYAGVNCGIMDQLACSLADTSHMLFLDTRTLARRLIPLPAGAELLVVDSGLSRSLGASAYNERRAECEHAARLLGVPALRDVIDPIRVDTLPAPLDRRARHVVSENARVLLAAQGVMPSSSAG